MTRRAIAAVAVCAATLLIVVVSSAAQTEPLTKYFSSYARGHRVTISRNGTVVTALDIPAGVWLSVYSDQQPVRTGQDGHILFHSNVEITMPNRDVQRPGSGDATDMMASAPLVLSAQNVDVDSLTIIP